MNCKQNKNVKMSKMNPQWRINEEKSIKSLNWRSAERDKKNTQASHKHTINSE